MEEPSQPKATLIVKVLEHGTITGTDDPIDLDFDDCVSAVGGLVGWLADALADGNEAEKQEIGAAILVDVLHHWTFDEYVDEDIEDESVE